ncbi:hypothetical protein FPHOBKDP_00130 [Listeria phage LPJP1]|nr:hypothetical protein FPHOBKDP_00130 [Listeria phage LPJP1]
MEQVTSGLLILTVLSVVIQYLVERIKDIFPTKVMDKLANYVNPAFWSLIVSLPIAFGINIDLFAIIGYNMHPTWLATLFTGFALSGRATGINELIKSLSAVKTNNFTQADSVKNTDEEEIKVVAKSKK